VVEHNVAAEGLTYIFEFDVGLYLGGVAVGLREMVSVATHVCCELWRFGKNSRTKAKNRKNCRESFNFDLKVTEFCPKSPNFAQTQGINSEFCGYLSNSLPAEYLMLLSPEFEKITGNQQGTAAPPKDDIFLQPA
jgi:hypothetical protein